MFTKQAVPSPRSQTTAPAFAESVTVTLCIFLPVRPIVADDQAWQYVPLSVHNVYTADVWPPQSSQHTQGAPAKSAASLFKASDDGTASVRIVGSHFGWELQNGDSSFANLRIGN
ncbi:hypothetical protein NUW54_g12791 [Trametes sanguinea]|uniref:Uncharacterized protein n=1 Tax=Trametes sanguinea TaxID=158606 RepID=A0ACC1MTV8_9APHY|nr:hypothetical protein NUW54_g12791 [Trametes sanguinea]